MQDGHGLLEQNGSARSKARGHLLLDGMARCPLPFVDVTHIAAEQEQKVSDVFEELKTPSASHKAELKQDELVIGPGDSDDASLGAFQLVAKKALLADGEGQIEIVTSHRNSDLPGMPYDQLTIRRPS
jgi:hypothetical protein